MNSIGISLSTESLSDDLFKKVKNSGLNSIEISDANVNKFKDLDYKKVKSLSERYDIQLWSLHLPFSPFDEVDPSALIPELQKHSFDLFSEIIKKGANIGIDKFVIHPSAEPIDDSERQDRLDSSAEFLSNLADFAYKYDSVIAVENLPRICDWFKNPYCSYI